MEYVWTIYGVSYKKNQTATLLVINIDAARTLPTNLHELYINIIRRTSCDVLPN